MIEKCVGSCAFVAPPPNSILSMPPPPLPSFLLPKSPMIASTNDTYPCFASFMCEVNPRPRESGMEFVELAGVSSNTIESSWVFILISSGIGVIILGGLLALVLLKCRDCNLTYHDTNIKQTSISAIGETSKGNSLLAGGILYPCAKNSNRDNLQSQLANDSRLLWAALTPHGTRHFVSEGRNRQDGLYEVVDYHMKAQKSPPREEKKCFPIKSFDNNGFLDYDYEDPTPLMESYHDDLDSGYQEPQEILNGFQHVPPRPIISSPTCIDHPNIAPLNFYPSPRAFSTTNGSLYLNSTINLNRKNTLCRRISDASSSYSNQNE